MIAPIGHRDAAARMVIASDDAVPATVREDVLLLLAELVDPSPAGSPVGARGRAKRGPFLVQQIADRWGVSRAGPGTCVWFEIEFER